MLSAFFWKIWAEAPWQLHQQTTPAAPFTDYDAQVAVYVLLVGFLVTVLLVGGMLILNLGLMSKRAEDRVGGRNPSDVGFLKNALWPEEPYYARSLPAEEDEDSSDEQKAA